jgi:hypothetical protein
MNRHDSMSYNACCRGLQRPSDQRAVCARAGGADARNEVPMEQGRQTVSKILQTITPNSMAVKYPAENDVALGFARG